MDKHESEGRTELFVTISNCDYARAFELIERGDNVNATTKYNEYIFHLEI